MRGLLKTLGALFAASVLTATGWAQETVPLAEGLQQYYSFDIDNNVSRGTSVALGGTYAQATTNPFGQGFGAALGVGAKFNRVDSGFIPGTDDFTCMLRFATTTTGVDETDGKYIISRGATVWSGYTAKNHTPGWSIKIGSDGKLTLNVGVGSTLYTITTADAIYGDTLQAKHLAWTRNGTTITLYVNGVSVGTTTLEANASISLNNDCWRRELSLNSFRWGASATALGTNDVLDELAFWGRALSDTEIKSIADSTASLDDLLSTSLVVRTLTAAEEIWEDVKWGEQGTEAAPTGGEVKLLSVVEGGTTLKVGASQVNLDKLIINGDKPLTITLNGSHKLTATTTTITTDTTVEAGAASLGAVAIAGGKTLTVKNGYFTNSDNISNGSKLLGPGSIALDLGAENGLTLHGNGAGKFSGAVNVLSGNLTITGDGGSGFLTGRTVNVLDGAAVTIGNDNATGHGNTPENSILHIQQRGTVNFTSRNSFKSTLKLTGGTVNLTGSDNADPVGRIKRTLDWMSGGDYLLAAALTGATAETPTVSTISQTNGCGLALRSALGIVVEEKAKLVINAPIVDARDAGAVTKKGLGVLELAGQNTSSNELTVEAGQMILSGAWAGALRVNAEARLTYTTSAKPTNTLTNNGTITADGERTEVNLTSTPILGSGSYAVTNGATLILPAGKEAGVTVPSGCTLKLALSANDKVAGYRYQAINDGGKIAFVEADGSTPVTEGVNGDTYTPPAPKWTPESAESSWTDSNRWTNKNIPTSGDVIVDASELDADIALEIPTSTTLGTVTIRSYEGRKVKLSLAGEASVATVVALGDLELPLAIVNDTEVAVSVADGKKLYVNVAKDAELTKAIIIDGAVVKQGTAKLTLKKSIFAGDGVTIDAGTIAYSNGAIAGNDNEENGRLTSYTDMGNVLVKNGATLDFNGSANSWTNTVTLDKGATLANDSKTGLEEGARHLRAIVLNGDATLRAKAKFSLTASGYNPSTVTLNGYTLTKTGDKSFVATNASISNGTFYLQEGSLNHFKNNISMASGITLKIDAGTTNNGAFNYQGDVAFDLADTVTMATSATLSGNITKKGAGALTIGGGISGTGAVTVEDGNLTLSGNNTYTGGTNIEEGATLTISRANALGTGAITGAGILVCDGVIPANKNGLTAETWTGKVTLNGTIRLENSANSLEALGNANSHLIIDGTLTGYLSQPSDTTICSVPVELNGSLTLTDGYNNKVYQINKLSGSGLLHHNKDLNYVINIVDGTAFEGSLKTTQNAAKIYLGEYDSSKTEAGKIVVATDTTIATGATWSGQKGLTILENTTLTVNGKITRDGDTVEPTMTIPANATLSGAGTIGIPLTLVNGAIIDATNGAVKVTGEVTLPPTGTVKVKVDKYGDVLKAANLDAAKFSLADDVEGQLNGKFIATVDALVYAPVIAPAAGKPAIADTVMAEVARAAGAEGVTTVTAVKPAEIVVENDKILTVDVNGAELFNNVISFENDANSGIENAKIATVSYLFGVSDINIKQVATATTNLTAQRYVVVCAKVSNATGESENTADYATGITLKLLNEDAEVSGVVEPTADELAALGLTAEAGERWLAVPMTTLFPVNQETSAATTVTMKLKVEASNTP